MKALSDAEFLEAEGLRDGCRACGGKLEPADRRNTNDQGYELPRFICTECGEIYEQTDDYSC